VALINGDMGDAVGTVRMPSGAGLTISSGIHAKPGSGTLTLSGSGTYTGADSVSVGALNVQNPSGIGSTPAETATSSWAALKSQGNISVGEESLRIVGTRVSNGVGLRNISRNNIHGGTVTLSDHARTNSDSGTPPLSNAFAVAGPSSGLTAGGAGGSVIQRSINTTSGAKSGNGTPTLSAPHPYAGTLSLSAGTLLLGGDHQIASNSEPDLKDHPQGAISVDGPGTLTLSASSTLDFVPLGAGTSVIRFGVPGGSQARALTASDYHWGKGRLLFAGSAATLINQFIRNDVSFNGELGYNSISYSAYYEVLDVPEPASWAAGALLLGLVGWRERRRLLRLP